MRRTAFDFDFDAIGHGGRNLVGTKYGTTMARILDFAVFDVVEHPSKNVVIVGQFSVIASLIARPEPALTQLAEKGLFEEIPISTIDIGHDLKILAVTDVDCGYCGIALSIST